MDINGKLSAALGIVQAAKSKISVTSANTVIAAKGFFDIPFGDIVPEDSWSETWGDAAAAAGFAAGITYGYTAPSGPYAAVPSVLAGIAAGVPTFFSGIDWQWDTDPIVETNPPELELGVSTSSQPTGADDVNPAMAVSNPGGIPGGLGQVHGTANSTQQSTGSSGQPEGHKSSQDEADDAANSSPGMDSTGWTDNNGVGVG